MTDRRWTCPNQCGQPGRLAPERARSDDARTYCLPCTERTGRLVRRVCEAAEKKRAARKQTKAERAKALKEAERVTEMQSAIDGAHAIATGQPIRTGYYYVHQRTRRVRDLLPPDFASGELERHKHPPAFAQIAATIYTSLAWYPYATDAAREATLNGLKRIDATAPGLFPLGAREYLDALPRALEVSRSSGSLYNWTVIVDALVNDAKRKDRLNIEQRPVVAIDPGSTTGVYVATSNPEGQLVHMTVTRDRPLADLVREDLLNRIRKAHSLLHPVADEIECAPAAFRGH